ncbi:hypothetical protein D3C72_1210860 [compost metagenome]
MQAADIVVFHAPVDGQLGAAVQGPQAAEQAAQQHADDDIGHEHRIFIDVGRADAQRRVGGRMQVQAGLLAFGRRIAVAHVIGAADIHDVLARRYGVHTGLAIDQLDARARGVEELRRHGGRVKRRGDGILFGRRLGVAADDGFERPARQCLFAVRAPRQLAHAAGQRHHFLLLGQGGRHGLFLLLLVGAMRQLESHGRQHGAFQLDARDGAHAFADARAGKVDAGRAARAYPRQVGVAVRLFGQDQHQLPAIGGQPVEQAVQRPLARLVLFVHGWCQVQVDGQHLAAARGGACNQLLQARTLQRFALVEDLFERRLVDFDDAGPVGGARVLAPVQQLFLRRAGPQHGRIEPFEHVKTFQRQHQRGDQAGADHVVQQMRARQLEGGAQLDGRPQQAPPERRARLIRLAGFHGALPCVRCLNYH